MHKIKKGIKKKIKGKKGKDDELFTPEELEKYKKEKEEEARRLAEQQPQQQEEADQQDQTHPQQEDSGAENEGAVGSSEEKAASSSEGGKDWRNFFAATDTVLKKTTDNLQHIKEASYFQKKEEKLFEPTAAAVTPTATAATAVAPSGSGKKWVDLEKGGIDDEDEVEQEEETQKEEQPQEEPEPEPEPAPLQFIEDLPDVDVDDFAEVFDTTYVDNVESGEVKLHYIPDSPTTDYANEPDPFDTSVVDKVLHAEEPEEKKPKSNQNQKEPEKKKKKKLVSLGCAVDVLTGKVQGPEKTAAPAVVDAKKRRVVQQEVNLLADFNENGEPIAESEENEKTDKEEGEEKPEEKNLLDELLCVGDETELPELGAVLGSTPRSVSPVVPNAGEQGESDVKVNEGIEGENKEVDLSEFLESSGDDQDSKETKQENGKDLDLKDLVAEFDIIDKSEVTNETLVPTEPDPIEDEFDAEFAFLAAESVAKAKEKEFEDLEDDPFDTSVAAHILGPEESAAEKDPFDVSFVDGVVVEETTQAKPGKPPPPRPAPPKVQKETAEEDVDPFDTSIAEKHLPVDHLTSPDADASLPEALKPQAESDLSKSASFDPFDTSIAESFGKTELKVLESELLSVNQTNTLPKSDSDFDFNPREEEEPKAAPCLLTSSEVEDTSAPVLAPSQDALAEDFDPFDTSIAAKVEIQTLEAEFLTEEVSAAPQKKQPPPRPVPSSAHLLGATPTDNNPTLLPSSTSEKNPEEDNFDPFDTSIAENFGKTELKVLESELLSSQETPQEVQQVPEEKKPDAKALNLPVKPLRPPSPRCLLAATPLDENPTLQPVLQPAADAPPALEEDFDPFDTSIADQFGKTELKVLESELLVGGKSPNTEADDSFDPRAEDSVPVKPSKPSRPPSPARPQCLLTASPSPTGPAPSLKLLAPTDAKQNNSEANDFDPFDTSIADKFGKSEIRNFESELLDNQSSSAPDPFDEFDPRAEEVKQKAPQRPPKPNRPPVPQAPCLLAATPTDSSVPLQPCIDPLQEPKEAVTAEPDFDPFDTSIADKLGKTEIKFLEESLLTKEENQIDTKPQASVNFAPNLPAEASLPKAAEVPSLTPDHLLSSSPTEDLGPTLQPTSSISEDTAEDFDPFDTSIADRFGKTELKTLESELLADSGVKRNLSDDEFDPRQEEIKAPKRTPPPAPKPATPVNLLDSSDDHNLPDPPVELLQAQSASEAIDDYDPFDTSIAADIGPSKQELKYLETELLSAAKDPFDTSDI